jgi:selenide,water dikinase
VESDACLVVAAVFKTVASIRQSRGAGSIPTLSANSSEIKIQPDVVCRGAAVVMSQEEVTKLTSLSSCAGCAAKLSQQELLQILHRLPVRKDPNLLVGSATCDDAGVYQIDRNRALVLTTDFFTPIVDDPFDFGQIAAANALSDVYAMGGRPLTALNIAGIPADRLPLRVVNRILQGGATKVSEARCVLAGGHTIRSPEPIYGLAVTGMVSPRRMLTNARAQAGDALVLTKPLGTGVITTGIKRGLTKRSLERKAIAVMTRLNTVGAELAESGLVKAAVDVTGFGLLGHLGSMCRASGVGAEIAAGAVPVISAEVFRLIEAGCIPSGSRDNLAFATDFTEWDRATSVQKTLLTDAQTSGGMLLCVSRQKLDDVLKLLIRHHAICTTVVGHIVQSSKPKIRVAA